MIDHIYVTDSQKVVTSKVLRFDLSDHFAVFVCYHIKSLKESTNDHKVLEFRSLKKFNVENFIGRLQTVPWETIYMYTDPNEALSAWYAMFMEILWFLKKMVTL